MHARSDQEANTVIHFKRHLCHMSICLTRHTAAHQIILNVLSFPGQMTDDGKEPRVPKSRVNKNNRKHFSLNQ